jgi:hypothetical protein
MHPPTGEVTEHRRNKSADLLKKEMQKHGRFASREYLAKVSILLLPVVTVIVSY